MSCSTKLIIDKSEHPEIQFVGEKCRLEIPCTRKDDHSVTGKHWYEKGIVRIEFEISEDAIWMA